MNIKMSQEDFDYIKSLLSVKQKGLGTMLYEQAFCFVLGKYDTDNTHAILKAIKEA